MASQLRLPVAAAVAAAVVASMETGTAALQVSLAMESEQKSHLVLLGLAHKLDLAAYVEKECPYPLVSLSPGELVMATVPLLAVAAPGSVAAAAAVVAATAATVAVAAVAAVATA